jgi:hypothetical protein
MPLRKNRVAEKSYFSAKRAIDAGFRALFEKDLDASLLLNADSWRWPK